MTRNLRFVDSKVQLPGNILAEVLDRVTDVLLYYCRQAGAKTVFVVTMIPR